MVAWLISFPGRSRGQIAITQPDDIYAGLAMSREFFHEGPETLPLRTLRDELRYALAMARSADPMSYATVVGWVYGAGIALGALAADDRVLREIEDALRIAERSADDLAVAAALMTLGHALVHRQTAAERDRGQ